MITINGKNFYEEPSSCGFRGIQRQLCRARNHERSA